MTFDDHDEERLVRPYFLTQGRTEAQLPIESMVQASSRRERGVLSVEQSQIMDLCREPKAIAEVAALLKLPLGVARVLIGDMVTDGLLVAAAPAKQFDDAFFDALIAGVERAAAAAVA